MIHTFQRLCKTKKQKHSITHSSSITEQLISNDVDKDSPFPLFCDFLCAAVESKIGKKIEDWDLFCETLRAVYIASGDDDTTISDTFINDTLKMIRNVKIIYNNNEQCNSPLPLLCDLICEAMDSGTLKHGRKLFCDILIRVSMASRAHLYTLRDDYTNDARSMIRITKMNLIDD